MRQQLTMTPDRRAGLTRPAVPVRQLTLRPDGLPPLDALVARPETSTGVLVYFPGFNTPLGPWETAKCQFLADASSKTVILTEIPGIRENAADPESSIDTELALADARRLLAAMPAPTQPTEPAFYLQHCVKACAGGVERSHILPYATDGALLLEVFTHDGVGTMVVDEKLESLREASADDVGGILQLIEPFERDGTLVRRERTEIERDIANYTVIEHDGIIFGCVALYPYAEERTGEMAALTVSPLSQNQGDGERLLKRVEQRARQGGLDSIFVLTTRTMHWFIKRGFVSVDPEWLPEARKRKYNWDRRSQVLVKKLV